MDFWINIRLKIHKSEFIRGCPDKKSGSTMIYTEN